MRWLFIAIVASTGCALVHERDAFADVGVPLFDAHGADAHTIDARRIDDGSRDDTETFEPDYFTLEPADVDLRVTLERCSESSGATAIARVTVHYFSSCDTPGPIDVAFDGSARLVDITPHLWHEHGRTDCASIGAEYTRDVPIVRVGEGAWTIVAGSTTTTLDVSGAPPIACPPPGSGTITAGNVCRADCECSAGLSCLAIRGDVACERRCADLCEDLGVGRDLSLSCARPSECTNDPNLGWICQTSTMNLCDEMNPCPRGMSCPPVSEGPRVCSWSIALNASIRHPCTMQSDCDPGLDCVQRVDGRRACEVRCTTSDMTCPSLGAGHACSASNWVCEWIGD